MREEKHLINFSCRKKLDRCLVYSRYKVCRRRKCKVQEHNIGEKAMTEKQYLMAEVSQVQPRKKL